MTDEAVAPRRSARISGGDNPLAATAVAKKKAVAAKEKTGPKEKKPAPAKGKKKTSKRAAKDDGDDDDEEEDHEEDEKEAEEEEDADVSPPPKKKAAPAKTNGKKRTAEEKEEEEAKGGEDGGEAEEEESAPAAKKQKKALAVGDTVPDFPLINEENQDVKLHDLVKEKGAVIFVYPAANTGGCTKQACDYRDHFTDFEKAGYQVFGMSKDKPTPQSNWKKKHNFQYHLLSDPHFSVQTAFGVASGKKVSRSHIVIEKGGKILDISKGVKPGDSAGQALETIGGKKW